MKGLTRDEREVIQMLGNAFTCFRALPRCFTDEMPEFVRHLHSAQMLVMARAAVRQFPESYNHVEGFK